MARAKKAVRAGGIVLIVVLALAAIGAGVVYFLVSRLDIGAEVERAVERSTGRQLTIAGDVGVSFFPVLGLEAHDASLANVEGGRADAFVAMDQIKVGVEIAPLFRREVVVRRLVLERPRIALEIDAEGRPNWIMQPQRPEGAPTPPGQTPQQAPQQPFSLHDVTINNGEVSYFDARRNTGWAVDDAHIRAALTSLDAPMQLEGRVRYNDEEVRLQIGMEAPREAFAGRGTPVSMQLNSDLVDATFEGQSTVASGGLHGQVRASGTSLRQLAAWAGAPITGGVGLERFAVSGEVGVAGGEISFSNAGFSVDQVRGRGDFVLMQRGGKPYVSGRLELFDFDLNPYISGVAPPQDELDPAGAATPAGVAGSDQTRAEIATVDAAPRSVDVTQAPGQAPIDFSALKAINADLEITTAKFLFQHMQIDRAVVSLVVHDGFLAATLHQLDLYGGAGHGRLEIDAREPVVRLEQEMALTGVDAHGFLSDAFNVSNIEGEAELTYRLRSTGRSQSDFIGAADGLAHLEVVSGAIRGVDLGGVARTIRNAMSGDLVSPDKRSPFQGFSATFAIADGVMASDNLSFNTPDLTMPGIGLIDVGRQRLDMRLAPRSPRGGIVAPFAVRGPFGRFEYTSDLRDRARREIEARVREVKSASR